MNPANKTGLNPQYAYNNNPIVIQIKDEIKECIEEKRILGEKLLKLRSSGTRTIVKLQLVRQKIDFLNNFLCIVRQRLSGNI